MPWLQTVYERYQGDDLHIVGLTTVSRSASDESVRRFIDEHDITYPMFKEDGSARDYMNTRGTPFMTLIRDGVLVWEHHLPTEQFPDQIVAKFIEAD